MARASEWRFLLDHDVPEDLTYLLEQLGHQVTVLRKALPHDSPDEAANVDIFESKAKKVGKIEFSPCLGTVRLSSKPNRSGSLLNHGRETMISTTYGAARTTVAINTSSRGAC